MSSATDWVAWHHAYADPSSALSRRLLAVQDQIRAALPSRAPRQFTIVSVCAGRGDDLIPVLASYPWAGRIAARLVESDPRNVAEMIRSASGAGLALDIVEGDAAELAGYRGAVPADLVLLCGVLGNVSDADAEITVRAMPRLCRSGATVIWTRSRRAPDRTPHIRRWFAECGYTELAFIAPDDVRFSVGAHRFRGTPEPLGAGRLFRFIR